MGEKNNRIGVINPSDGVLDFEFWRFVPPGVSVHLTRVPSSADMAASLGQSARHAIMAESTDLDEAAKTFSLIYAGSGAPAVTTSTAAVAALRALGVKKTRRGRAVRG